MGLKTCIAGGIVGGIFLILVPIAGWAEPVLGHDLFRAASGMVRDCPDARTLVLNDGAMVRLAGIEVPLPLPGGGQGPLAELARRRLCARAQGQQVLFYTDGQRHGDMRDRYGRLVAYGMMADGSWLQGDLLSAGFARVDAAPGMTALADLAIMQERAAREAHLGLWDDPVYRVRSVDDLDSATGQFLILEARLCAVTAQSEGWVLDLRSAQCDMQGSANEAAAAIVMAPDKGYFTPGLTLLRGLIGQRLRLRGTMLWRGRPILHLVHRTAVEPLGP